jgi:ribosomal protein L37E
MVSFASNFQGNIRERIPFEFASRSRSRIGVLLSFCSSDLFKTKVTTCRACGYPAIAAPWEVAEMKNTGGDPMPVLPERPERKRQNS